jgi:hypothetical protein
MDYRFPSIEDVIKKRERYKRPRPKRKSTREYHKPLTIKTLNEMTQEKIEQFDFTKLYEVEFKLYISHSMFIKPEACEVITGRLLKTRADEFEKISTRGYFRKLKAQILFARKTIWHLKREEDCSHECRKCPLIQCIRGGGKNKLSKLEAWMKILRS